MKKYKNSLRIGMAMKLGKTSKSTSREEEWEEIDKAIIKLADQELTKTEKTTFFYAFQCQETLRDIQEKFAIDLDRYLKLETIQKYCERTSSIILDRMSKKPRN